VDSIGLSAASSTLASLLAILALLAGAAFVARHLRARLPGGDTKPQAAISIVASRPLGGQHSLIIAEAAGSRFLIGVSRTGMTAIGRLDAHD
jgi:flagellar biogenesis protein FliO